MCGIYGSTKIYSESQFKEKVQRTHFRGPDESGLKTFNSDSHTVTFGHNRLAIVDLDPRSNQPFSYHGVHIVFNGEIYNFHELKNTLANKGYIFKTTSDTEVICAAYIEFGENCVQHFNGMFAFVIYDEAKKLLFGARDRLGQKPFYYYLSEGEFEFASQISPIALHNQNLSISQRAISYYLAWNTVPDSYSIYNEVKKLKAGHTFTYHLSSKQFDTKEYWDINFSNKPSYIGSYQDAQIELEQLLNDAVKMRLFADVPVGVFLSGGIDSSLIAALATQTTTSKIKTFSVKFNEKGFDESIYAQQVADHLKTDHHVIECNYNEGLELIDNFSHFYDEPFADPSAIPSMLLSKHTRKKVTVALSGDAGDENFIGYQRYKWINQVKALYNAPKPLRKGLSVVLDKMPYYKLKSIGKGLSINDINELYLGVMTSVDLSYLDTTIDLYDLEEKKYLFHKNKNVLERISDFDTKTYLNWDINTKVDRATMAFSLEARSPLMDYRIFEFGRSLPTEFKFRNNDQKRILKDVLYKYVPKHIFDRPKAGFTMPFSEWFRGELKDYVLQELSLNNLKDIPNINPSEVKNRIDQHMDGSWNRYPLIWKLLVLKQWLKVNGQGISIQ